ncbi:recombinase family protein [Massilia sp. GER05]|uniref:recombinase family protein n=1 Tax=Massilia sp. GER05 TaxID=3394605 RepID=UPI003F870F57
MATTDKPRDPAFMLKQLMAIAEAADPGRHRVPEPANPGDSGDQVSVPGAGESDLPVLAARRASGETYAAIAADLNRRGIRGRYGARWYSASVWALLHRQPGGQVAR